MESEAAIEAAPVDLPAHTEAAATAGSSRAEVRQSRFKLTHALYVCSLVLLVVLQLSGIAFFTKGFLLLRQVLDDVAVCDEECFPPVFSKAVVLVIDALRFDFVVPGEDTPYHNHLQVLWELHQQQPDNALLLKFMADPPTTTLQRLKGLTTGLLPTFIDAGSNFDGDVIDEDNWVLQLHRANKTVAFMGDDTWDALFRPFLAPELCFPYPLLNVWDLDTVDNGVIEHLYPLLPQAHRWDVLIGHFLGVDHVGHRFGPNHHLMAEKQRQMDTVLRDTINGLDDNTLLVVLGDHGMDHTGNHGGDSADELEALVFFYSKHGFVQQMPAEAYNVADSGAHYRSVNQIDLVPTLLLLLGMPVPFNNLGAPIDELFPGSLLLRAHHITLQQIHRYRQATALLVDDEEVNALYAEMAAASADLAAFVAASKAYQQLLLEHCKDLWARFDMTLIFIGLGMLVVLLFILALYLRLILLVVVLQMVEEYITATMAVLPLGLVVMAAVYTVLHPSNMLIWWCLLVGVDVSIILGFLAPIFDRYSLLWLLRQAVDLRDPWLAYAVGAMVLHLVVFASNLFTVWEDRLVLFLLLTFGVLCVVSVLRQRLWALRVIGLYHLVVFLVLTRLAQAITVCREEQGAMCVPTFRISGFAVVLLYVVAVALPLSTKAFYRILALYEGAAPVWLGRGLAAVLVLNAAYWTMEYVEHRPALLSRVLRVVGVEGLQVARMTVARVVFGITLVAANFAWLFGPLCIRLLMSADTKDTQDTAHRRKVTILGYGNVYGLLYFLFVSNTLAAVMLANKPLGAILVFLLTNQLLLLLELFDLLQLRHLMAAPVVLGLLLHAHFFSTGHQATLALIQWDMAYMTTELIAFPYTHLQLVLNTLGLHIVVCLAVPLVVLWKIGPSTKPILLLLQVVECAALFLMYHAVVATSSMIWAAFFRRHLMVWKVFAPRFMLGGVTLAAVGIVLSVAAVGFGTGKVIKQASRVFG